MPRGVVLLDGVGVIVIVAVLVGVGVGVEVLVGVGVGVAVLVAVGEGVTLGVPVLAAGVCRMRYSVKDCTPAPQKKVWSLINEQIVPRVGAGILGSIQYV